MKLSKYLKNILIGSILIFVILLAGCGKVTNSPVMEKKPDKVTITDMSGTNVEVPVNINRIADAWPANHAMLCMLGAGGKVVATINMARTPWMEKLNPQYRNAVAVFDATGTANMEELIKAKPDVIFTTLNNKNTQKLKELGIPVVQLYLTDFDSLKECVRIEGNVLGEQAKNRAERYIAYLDDKIAMITAITSHISRDQRPKVLHITSFGPLTVDGTDTIVNSWIEIAGGINAAEVSGNNREVSVEQILKWNPDVIIIGNNALTNSPNGVEDMNKLLTNPVCQQVNAVKKGKVFINPEGVYLWDRYGAEEALQIQWAAKVLYPDKFQNINMVNETRYFYNTFFDYDLSKEEANTMLNDNRQ